MIKVKNKVEDMKEEGRKCSIEEKKEENDELMKYSGGENEEKN